MVKKILLATGLLLSIVTQTVFATTLDIDDYHRVIIQNDVPSNQKYALGLNGILDRNGAYMPSSTDLDGAVNDGGVVGYSVAAIAIDSHKIPYYLELGSGGNGLVRRLGGSSDWNMSSNTESGNPTSLKTHAVSWFAKWGKTYFDGITEENMNNGSYRINTDETGHKYICNSLYLRYTNINDPFELISWSGGPYITKGTNFDDVLDYNKIKADPGSWVQPASEEVGYDAFGNSGWNYNDRRSVFQKNSEFRLYITPSQHGNPDDKDPPYAYLYPMERVQQIEQSEMILGNPSGTLSTKANASSGNVSFTITGKVDLPIKNDDISSSQMNLFTSEKTKTYQFNSAQTDPSIANGEPSEKQLKAWYSNVNAVMTISLPNGKTYTENNVTNSFNFSTNVSTSQLGTGNTDLTGSLVKVTYTYDENQRFMSEENQYLDMYVIRANPSDAGIMSGNYSDTKTYITTKLGNNATNQNAITQMTTYHNNKDRLTKKVYKTVTNKKTVTLTASLSYIAQSTPEPADIKPLKITQKVYPNQPTTVLEGGSMYATIDVLGLDATDESLATRKAGAPNTKTYRVSNSGDSPEPKYAEWHSDVKIESIQFVTKDDSILYDSANTDNPPTVTQTNNLNHIAVKVPGGQGKILANPTDVGTANIIIKYSYNWKIRELTKTVAGQTAVYRTERRKSTRTDSDGNKHTTYHNVQVFDHWDYWWDKTYQTTTNLPQMGEQKFPFTIYSLSSQTTQK